MPNQPNTLFAEDFDDTQGATPPEGWTQVALPGDSGVAQWEFDDVGNPDPFGGSAAYFFDLAPIEGEDPEQINAALVSPVFTAAGADEAYLLLAQEFQARAETSEQGGEILIETTTDGETWTTVFSDDRQGFFDPEGRVFDVSEAIAGAEEVQLRLRFEGNESVFWAVDTLRIVDDLVPGITGPEEGVGVSESNVPDTQNFEFAVGSRPEADVTLNFVVDGEQLEPIESLTFTPENWTEAQAATVRAVADGIDEGSDQVSEVRVEVVSDDPDYDGLEVEPVAVEITDRTIPGFPTYRTVEATFEDLSSLAVENPELTSWIDIGDSYDKATPGGPEGYDIYALRITNEATDREGFEKPVLFMQGSIHAREYATAEIVSRFAEDLVAGYGTRAETTWLLDNTEIHVVPYLNPDGRKFAEQGYLWRKNTNPNPPEGEDAAPFPDYGVDLNRNYDAAWGEIAGGSSGDPASAVYRGSAPFSEPESQAARDYLLSIFPDQKPDDPDAPAPEDATGVYLDVHSYGRLILYPQATDGDAAPNLEGLRDLGLKFGYFTGTDGEAYNVQGSEELYATDGTTDAWVYDTLGAAAYTFELGTAFFQDSEYFQDVIRPEITPAFFYAAKASAAPYLLPEGPDSVGPEIDTPTVFAGQTITLSATADATRYDDGLGEFDEPGADTGELPEIQPVAGARYSIDALPYSDGAETFEMAAADGAFDGPVEAVQASVDTAGLEPGPHILFVQSRDEGGAYGAASAVFFEVIPGGEGATEVIAGGGGVASRTGGAAQDIVRGEGAGGPVAGGPGDDVLFGGAGDDILRGDPNTGSRRVGREGGDDTLYGLGGDDLLAGQAGDDVLYGGSGRDRLYGDDGDDVLRGGAGDDYLVGDGRSAGGAGQDTFVLTAGQGTDTIRDFTAGTDLLGLAGDITFDQLEFSQPRRATLVTFDGEVLAQLDGVSVDEVSEDWFVLV